MTNPQEKSKIEYIKELVEHDLSNGRHAHKKLHKMMKKQGQCPVALCEQIKALKPIGK